jgi:hydrogenase maturation protein HypF
MSKSCAEAKQPAGDRRVRASLRLPKSKAVVALGGDLKNVIGLMRDSEVRLSETFGDLADAGAYRRFIAAVAAFEDEAAGTEITLCHDLHPAYLSTARTAQSPHPRVAVQHHHAHIASCLADNEEHDAVIGIACDGTGYGTDGAIWGCEMLVCDLHRFDRVGHLGYALLPGGDAAARETWRPALSLACMAYDGAWHEPAASLFAQVPEQDLATVERMLRRNVNCIPGSSLGRLFDAVAFLLGLCAVNETEAQAAQALEACAAHGHVGRALPFEVVLPAGDDSGQIVMDVCPMIRALVEARLGRRHVPDLAADFHETVVAMLATSAEMVADRTGLRRVALSGGCFFNRRLVEGLSARLAHQGLTVLRHRQVSPGDAGLALGQAVIAAAQVGAS